MSVYEFPDRVNVEGVYISKKWFKRLVEKGSDFDDFQLNKDTDVVVATYPRTGTTWTCQIVSLLYAGEDKYEEVSQIPIEQRALFIELEVPDERSELDKLQDMKPPRIVKTHLPYKFVNRWVVRDKVKTIVTLRNPKDTLVSLYHFTKLSEGVHGTWDEFFAHIQTGKQFYGDMVDWMESWWEQRDDENIVILKYEDMLADLPTAVRKIIHFLQVNVTEKTFDRVVNDAMFSIMSKNPNISHKSLFGEQGQTTFVRSGKVGQWKQYFTVAQNQWFDDKYSTRLEKSGMELTFE